MLAVEELVEQPKVEYAAPATCAQVGYYFKVTPRLARGHFWVGPFPEHASTNDYRRKNYAWPRFFTGGPSYFVDGETMG